MSHGEDTQAQSPEKDATHTGVTFDGRGNAIFGGNSSVVLWQSYQTELGSGFRLSVRVKPRPPPASLTTLLSDGDCSGRVLPSVLIAFQTVENDALQVVLGLSLQNKEGMAFLNLTTTVSTIPHVIVSILFYVLHPFISLRS